MQDYLLKIRDGIPEGLKQYKRVGGEALSFKVNFGIRKDHKIKR